MELMQDDFILLSFLNMKLRDEYCNLDELCAALDISSGDICGRMKNIGYYYDSEDNAFIRV